MPWPDAAHARLLGAALADGDRAPDAFAAWAAMVDLDTQIDAASFALLPLVHANLERSGGDHPLMNRLAGLRRHGWVQSQLRLRAASATFDALDAAGLPVVVAGDLPLAFHVLDDPSQWPIGRIDLLVERARHGEAAAVLRRMGWQRLSRPAGAAPAGMRPGVVYGAGLPGRSDREAGGDICWTLADPLAAEGEAGKWAPIPFMIQGRTLLRPSATRLLLHSVIPGLRSGTTSPIGWIAHAALIMRHAAGEIDWSELVAAAARRRLAYRFGLVVAYLESAFDIPVPGWAADRLGAARAHWIERFEAATILRTGTPGNRRERLLSRLLAGGRMALSGERGALPGMVIERVRRAMGARSKD